MNKKPRLALRRRKFKYRDELDRLLVNSTKLRAQLRFELMGRRCMRRKVRAENRLRCELMRYIIEAVEPGPLPSLAIFDDDDDEFALA